MLMGSTPKGLFNKLVTPRIVYEVVLADGYVLSLEAVLFNKNTRRLSFLELIFQALVDKESGPQQRSDKTMLALVRQVQSGPFPDKVEIVMDTISYDLYRYFQDTWQTRKCKSQKKWNLQFNLKLITPNGELLKERTVYLLTANNKESIFKTISKTKALSLQDKLLSSTLLCGKNEDGIEEYTDI